jgi:hypothetical protein
MLAGPRQTGKTTLARGEVAAGFPEAYLTFDDATTLAAAHTDPDGFVAALPSSVVIDEVQRAPGLFRAIKASIDRDRRPGRFLLTGSADALAIPNVSESLAGRVELVPLWPLTEGEVRGVTAGFVDRCFDRAPLPIADLDGDREQVLALALRGGYPEVVTASADRRQRWFDSYVDTIIARDVRELAAIDRLVDLRRLLVLLAARHGSLLNYADLGRDAGIPQSTLKRYLGLLTATYLVQLLPAWSVNTTQRLVKAPKVSLTDNGLVTALLRLDRDRIDHESGLLGSLVETFVVNEIRTQATWSAARPRLHHFRSHAGAEVDLVLEGPGGRIVGIEVKAASTVDARDFAALHRLAEIAGPRFARGIVCYTGPRILPFGEDLNAMPISALWSLDAQAP